MREFSSLQARPDSVVEAERQTQTSVTESEGMVNAIADVLSQCAHAAERIGYAANRLSGGRDAASDPAGGPVPVASTLIAKLHMLRNGSARLLDVLTEQADQLEKFV